jgi:hypothetical protein
MDAPASLLIHGDNPRAPDPSPPVHNALNPNPADVEAVESFLRSPPPTLGSLVEILKYTPALSEFEDLPAQLLYISDLVASTASGRGHALTGSCMLVSFSRSLATLLPVVLWTL